MVNWDGNILIDTFVRVKQPVTDFRTHVSGIYPCDIIADDAMEFEDCRDMVAELIRDKILIGHGLKNDLNVLFLDHPWHQIRDSH